MLHRAAHHWTEAFCKKNIILLKGILNSTYCLIKTAVLDADPHILPNSDERHSSKK
jgi:hypothetical protein